MRNPERRLFFYAVMPGGIVCNTKTDRKFQNLTGAILKQRCENGTKIYKYRMI